MVEKEFGCDNCGHKLIAISPDDSYTNFFIKQCCEKSIERKIECDDCDFRNIRYWCIEHFIPPVIMGIGAKDPYADDRFSTYV